MNKTISSIGNFIEVLRQDFSDKTEPIWYRGQINEQWGLIPSLLRGSYIEHDLISKFKQNATLLISTKPEHELEWLLIMQHYEIPTRLLDWSENPLVALYFAVTDDNGRNDDADGAFWCLLPAKLNEMANINMDEDRIPSIDENWVNNYLPSKLRYENMTKLRPMATIPPRNNQRMQAQSGVFTIWHRDLTPIDLLGKDKFVTKYIIPKASKEQIKNELNFLGFNKFRLFPELSSIADLIREGK